MNKRKEVLFNRAIDATSKLSGALTNVFSSLERFRLAGLEQLKAIRLMDEKLELMDEKLELISKRFERLEKYQSGGGYE